MNNPDHIPLNDATLKELTEASRKIDLEEKVYHEISRYHCYWLGHENREFKESLAIWVGYTITGNFNPSLFLKSLSFLTDRHESLRSHFLWLNDKYYITAEENDRFFEQAFAHSLMLDPGNEQDKINWIYFKDHTFDIQKGPLFQVRLARKEQDSFLVSIKVHHAILDTWSWGILIRDLFTAYNAFETGQLPSLPPLWFQYKEWLGWRRHLIEKNYHPQKLHWDSLYKALPGRLLIPGAKTDDSRPHCRQGKKDYFLVSRETMGSMQNLCRKYHVNLFMMARASFMLYLSKLTGQTDIMIGTMVTGRTTISSHIDQIGFYAYTDLTRIIFAREDSLPEAVEKIKRSFKDMYLYNDYTLHMALSDMNSPGKISSAPFWNVNLDFESTSGDADDTPLSHAEPYTGIRLDPLPGGNTGILTDMDLKLKIVNRGDKIEIRVLYDAELYDSPAINNLITGYLGFIDKNNDL